MNASEQASSHDSDHPSADQLASLIDQRLATLRTLLSLTDQQEEVIRAGHMNPLMPLLAEKQRWIEAFVEQSRRLIALRDQFPDPPPLSDVHRERHSQCDQLHRELLEREASCEQQLVRGRDALEQKLNQNQGAAHAVSRYNESATNQSQGRGGSLDLSSDG